MSGIDANVFFVIVLIIVVVITIVVVRVGIVFSYDHFHVGLYVGYRV